MIEGHKDWYKCEGASQGEIEALKSTVSFDLPVQYIDLLKYSNVGEGPLPVEPFNFVLDSVEQATDPEFLKSYKENFPGYFVFGGNGGGEFIALEINTGRIVALDSTNIILTESVLHVAACFREFIKLIGSESDSA